MKLRLLWAVNGLLLILLIGTNVTCARTTFEALQDAEERAASAQGKLEDHVFYGPAHEVASALAKSLDALAADLPKDELVPLAMEATGDSTVFEKEDFVAVGGLLLHFDESGRFVGVDRDRYGEATDGGGR